MVNNAVNILVQQKKATHAGRIKKTSSDKVISSLTEKGVDMNTSALWQQVRRSFDANNYDVPEMAGRRYHDPDDNDSDDNDVLPSLSPQTPREKGRPKGSTDIQKKEDENKYSDFVDAISYDYSTEKSSRKLKKERCAKGFLETLITDRKHNAISLRRSQ